jgi:hypothetical protein
VRHRNLAPLGGVLEMALLPGSGHAINLEEPAPFNRLIEDFIANVERRSWRPRDARAVVSGRT